MITQSGQSIQGSARRNGVDPIAALTKMPGTQGYAQGVNATSAAAQVTAPPQVEHSQKKLAYWLVGAIIGLALIKVATEHKKSSMEVHHLRVSVYNWMIIGLMSITFILASRAIGNKYLPRSGATKLVNGV